MPFYWEARRLRNQQRRRLGIGRESDRPANVVSFREFRERRVQPTDEIERLRSAVEAIKQATIEGRVCDDVAWFDTITTLHDFCEQTFLPRMS